MRYRLLFLIIVSVLIISVCRNSEKLAASNIEIISAYPNLEFTRPVDFQSPRDDSNRIFIVEQQGIIYVFNNSPDTDHKNVFLDITDRVNDRGNEEGLLGLAFHPQFKQNGYFYVDYTASNPSRTIIARYSVNSANANQADQNSERVLLEIPQPYSNHNGGQISFGPDNFLYIALGDGGSAGDPQNNGQTPATLLGSILRIDVDTISGSLAYGIPPDNPFVKNTNGYREEIFAYGLRNPWRFSFDLTTNRLWTGDVGQNKYEEIDIIRKGGNYGWNIMEGFHPYRRSDQSDSVTLIEPVWEYDHSVGQSITGGFVYRGIVVPELTGLYLYADYVSGKIWALRYDGKNNIDNKLLFDTDLFISSFGRDDKDELYFCSFDGKIYRFQTKK
jgi:glucose/arabinose dehydrogenase